MENLPAPGCEAVLERREAEHLFRVLRAAPGERFRLIDGRGNAAVAAVAAPGRKLVVESVRAYGEPPLRMHLFFALPRRSRLDALLTGCAELGVRELHPVVCRRSVAESEPNGRWKLHLVEGCKQSGNPFLPKIHPPEPLLPALRRAAEQGIRLYYGSVGEAPEPELKGPGADVGWVVGPEGGFTLEEESAMGELGVLPLHLGDWVMRLETAALCGVAVLRRILACAAAVLVLMFAGCGETDALKHPLTRKGDRFRDSGEFRLAHEFYRRASEKFPRHAGLQLRLAALCDESLDDPLGAAWHYSEFLRLAPRSPERAAAEKCREAALARVAGGRLEEKLGRLEEENFRLRKLLAEVKKHLVEMRRRQRPAFPPSTPPKPPPLIYTVRSGDTPALVAARHGIPVEALLKSNDLRSDAVLRIGQELKIQK